METCWHSQKNKVYAVLFLLWRGKCWWLDTEKLEQLFFSQLWPDQFVDKLFSRY